MRARGPLLIAALAVLSAGLWFVASRTARRTPLAPVDEPLVVPSQVDSEEVRASATRPPAVVTEKREAVSATEAGALEDGLEVFVHDAGSLHGEAGVKVLFADTDMLPEMRSVHELLDAVGFATTTDAGGRTQVPTPLGEFCIVARAPGRFGRASRRDLDPASGTVRLALLPDPTLDVRVLEASGIPAQRVRVGLVSRVGERQGWLEEWSTSDADGRLVLHPGRWGETPLFLHALIAAPEPVERALGPDGGPQELRLPPCGRIELFVEDGTGSPEPREIPVRVEFADGERLPIDSGPAGLRLLSDGHATLEHVVAGMTFDIRAGTARSEELELAAGETRHVTLTHPIGTRVTARLLDSGGAPLAGRLIRRSRLGPGAPAGHPGEISRCDSEGRLSWWHSEREDGDPVELRLATAGRFRVPLAVALAYSVTPGALDLGDLRFQPEPLLVGGVVVDEMGAPVGGADVTCGLLQPGAINPVWRPDLTAITDARGRFAIHSEASAAALSLAVDRPEHVPVRDLSAATGTSDLRVVLARSNPGGSIVGAVLVDGGAAALQAIEVRAFRMDGGTGSRPLERAVGPWIGSHFEIPEVPPGSYSVELRWNLLGITRTLRTIEPVEVAGGAPTRDPRLDPVDLRGALVPTRLEIVGPDGEPVVEAYVRFLDPRVPEGEPGQRLGERLLVSPLGTHQFVLPGSLVELEVLAAGCRPARLRGGAGSSRVVLEVGPEVTLLPVRDDPVPRPPGVLEVGLQSARPNHRFVEVPFRPWGLEGATGLHAGEPGEYWVQFRWTPPGGKPVLFSGGHVEVGAGARQSFEVALPARLAAR